MSGFQGMSGRDYMNESKVMNLLNDSECAPTSTLHFDKSIIMLDKLALSMISVHNNCNAGCLSTHASACGS